MRSFERYEPPYGLDSPCWIWTKSLAGGYAQFKVRGRQLKGHRFAFESFVRPLATGELVLHNCDRPACVNPAHLRAGTHGDNADDRRKRNRSGYRKISDSQCEDIKERANAGESLTRLARDYDVTPPMIGHIVYGRERMNPTKSKEPERLERSNQS